jgi:hypothetical protein
MARSGQPWKNNSPSPGARGCWLVNDRMRDDQEWLLIALQVGAEMVGAAPMMPGVMRAEQSNVRPDFVAAV